MRTDFNMNVGVQCKCSNEVLKLLKELVSAAGHVSPVRFKTQTKWNNLKGKPDYWKYNQLEEPFLNLNSIWPLYSFAAVYGLRELTTFFFPTDLNTCICKLYIYMLLKTVTMKVLSMASTCYKIRF